MSEKYLDKDYIFLTALLRARQANMLTGECLEQMLDAGTFAEAAKILADAGWPDMTGMDSRGIENTLAARREELFADIARMAPQPELVDLFRIRYDYHNAKSLIKGEAAGVAAEHLLSGAGRVTKDVLEKAFLEDNFRSVPDALGASMREAKTLLACTGNPQLADFALDKACCEEMGALAQELGNEYASDYVKVLIDGVNLRTAVRCVRMQKDPEFLAGVLLSGGTVSREHLVQAVCSGEGVAAAFSATIYREAALLGAEAVKCGRLTAFEQVCDNTVNRFLKDAKMKGFGAEAAIGYLGAEENNITAVRMVLTGLLANIAPERLRERLRDTYV